MLFGLLSKKTGDQRVETNLRPSTISGSICQTFPLGKRKYKMKRKAFEQVFTIYINKYIESKAKHPYKEY